MSGSVIPVESQSMIASGLMLILDPMPIPGRLRAGTSALYDRWACGLERFNVQQFGDRSHPVVWQFDRIPQNLGARRDAGAVDAAGGFGPANPSVLSDPSGIGNASRLPPLGTNTPVPIIPAPAIASPRPTTTPVVG